jgi:hypothetical protein
MSTTRRAKSSYVSDSTDGRGEERPHPQLAPAVVAGRVTPPERPQLPSISRGLRYDSYLGLGGPSESLTLFGLETVFRPPDQLSPAGLGRRCRRLAFIEALAELHQVAAEDDGVVGLDRATLVVDGDAVDHTPTDAGP